MQAPDNHLVENALELIKHAGKDSGSVGRVRPITIEPAQRPDGKPLSWVYWQDMQGRIVGPGQPELFARDGETYWLAVSFEGQTVWINADRLRSRQAYDHQHSVVSLEPVREPR